MVTTSYQDNITVSSYSLAVNSSDNPLNSTPQYTITCPDPPYPVWGTALLSGAAGLTSFCTTIGNILVVMAFILQKNLRQPSNYLIASLAVTDILIGLFSMPLYSLYLLKSCWPLGQTLCDLWLSLDYTVCLVSQYTVFLITLDRFCSVKAPAKYRNWRTKRKMKIMIAVTWLVPAFIFFTSIMGWRTFTGSKPPGNYICAAEFQNNPLFTVILVISYYWVTLVIMIGLYIGIYRVALSLHAKSRAKRKKMKKMKQLTSPNNNNNADDTKPLNTKGSGLPNNNDKSGITDGRNSFRQGGDEVSEFSNEPSSSDNSYGKRYESTENGTMSTTIPSAVVITSVQESPLWRPRRSLPTSSIQWGALGEADQSSSQQSEAEQLIDTQNIPQKDVPEGKINGIPHSHHDAPKSRFVTEVSKIFSHFNSMRLCKHSTSSDSPKSKSENRARKALRTITFILGAFVICWTPYHVVVIVYSFCTGCVNATFYEFTYWLCYMNSPLNPFCYALSNQQFKQTFIKIIKGGYFRRRNR